MAERRERRITSLRDSMTQLESQKNQLETELTELKLQLKQDPSTTVQRHIRLLHEYNEIKDVAMGLMGLVAEARGVRLIEVLTEYGAKEQD